MGWQNIVFNQIVVEGTNAGIFIYNGAPGNGDLIGSWAAVAGVDPFGNPYPAGINVTQGALIGVTITNSAFVAGTILNTLITGAQIQSSQFNGGNIFESVITFDSTAGGLFLYSTSTTNTLFNVGGTYTYTVPNGVSSGNVQVTGANAGGGGGNASAGGEAGGGGGFSGEPTYPMTGGDVLNVIVGNGGNGGITGQDGQDGGDSSFDQQGIYAFGGQAGDGGFGGSGGGPNLFNTINFGGGQGGNSGGTAGAGGGAQATASGNGANGGNSAGNVAGTGGAVGGGNGGTNGNNGSNGTAGAGGGAGAGSATNTFSGSFRPIQTSSYYGSQSHTSPANGRRNNNGAMYQGAASGDLSVTGDQYSIALYNKTAINNLIGSGTVSSVSFEVTNDHSWYNGGMYLVMGYANFGSLGSTGNLSGASLNKFSGFISEGNTQTFNVTSAYKAVLNAGNFSCLIFGPSSSTSGGAGDLYNYGYQNGGASFGPILKITGTSGTGSNTAGSGTDGKVSITVTSSSAMLGGISAIANQTDASGNTLALGWTGPVTAIQPSSSPAIPEVWHTITPPTGWSGTSRYKLLAQTNMVYLDIAVSASAQGAKGTFAYASNLPSGYYNPTESMTLPLTQTNNTAKVAPDISLFISTAGLISYFHVDVGTTRLDCHESYPID